VQVDRRQRGAQPAPPSVLQGGHVVDPAVGAVVERQCRARSVATEAGDQQVVRGVAAAGERVTPAAR
jgi:hypothetical protein